MLQFFPKILLIIATSMTILIANQKQKIQLGRYAAQLVQDDMTVALGTGSTVKYFIYALADRCKKENISLKLVASSKQSQKLAESLGMEILDPCDINTIDMMVDGADQVNAKKELIKGGGGALLREKLLALRAQKVIIMIHKEKLVTDFSFPLAVEITPFSYPSTMRNLERLGLNVTLRMHKNAPFLSDNHNYIVDVDYSLNKNSMLQLHQKIKLICGVVETGFFTDFNKKVLVANESTIQHL